MKEYHRNYRIKHYEELKCNRRIYEKKRRLTDPKFRLDKSMKSAVRDSLKGLKFGRRWESLVGYTLENLVKHLESKFDEKMIWHNYCSYWEIDHIKPISSFKYKTAEENSFRECWGLENLRPLEKLENRIKSNKY